jgi:hypothetical protein
VYYYSRRIINNGTTNKGPNEAACLANDTEETEEQKFAASRCNFGDHDLGIGVPRANEEL